MKKRKLKQFRQQLISVAFEKARRNPFTYGDKLHRKYIDAKIALMNSTLNEGYFIDNFPKRVKNFYFKIEALRIVFSLILQ